MSIRTIGADHVADLLRRLPDAARERIEDANAEGGRDLERVARTLVPEKSGATRQAITGAPQPGGGYLVDFGPLSKILEGGTAPRVTLTGASRGEMPALPFVNPALQATRAQRRRRIREALQAAIRSLG